MLNMEFNLSMILKKIRQENLKMMMLNNKIILIGKTSKKLIKNRNKTESKI